MSGTTNNTAEGGAMKATHTWTTQTGATVTATAGLQLSEQMHADGWDVGSRECCKYQFDISVEGYGVVGCSITRKPMTVKGVEYAATCGKLAITQDNLDAIDAMVADVQAHPAYVAKMAREDAAAVADREYYESTRRVHAAMAE